MLQQMMDLVTGVFTGVDQTTWIIMVVIVLLAALLMRAFGQIITITLGALVVFALATAGRQIAAGADPLGLAQERWNSFLALSVGQFLVYFLAFAIVIAGIFMIKSVFQRAG
jgi:hypothetical protein